MVNLDIIKLLGKDKVQINCCPSKSEKLNLIKIGPSGLQTYNIYYRQKKERGGGGGEGERA